MTLQEIADLFQEAAKNYEIQIENYKETTKALRKENAALMAERYKPKPAPSYMLVPTGELAGTGDYFFRGGHAFPIIDSRDTVPPTATAYRLIKNPDPLPPDVREFLASRNNLTDFATAGDLLAKYPKPESKK